MIISASRRTDIPAFYSKWFMDRIREKFCLVSNPFNPKQISKISLDPPDVDAIVFWTRYPQPFISHLSILDKMGYGYYFLFTLLDYPEIFEPKSPGLNLRVNTFKELSDKIGPKKVIWRYDPIIISNITPYNFHLKKFESLACELKDFTKQVIISFIDIYPKVRKRFKEMENKGVKIEQIDKKGIEFLRSLKAIANENNIKIQACAEKNSLCQYGIKSGKCIDDRLIYDLFGIRVSQAKDKGQRKECLCVPSRDIGMYDTCIFGCKYCYAITSFKKARKNFSLHDPELPQMVPI